MLQNELRKIASGPEREKEKIKNISELLFDVVARSVPVDEKFYLENYPDVAAAVASGDVKSASEHFISHGFYENRLPMAPMIDEEAYLDAYPDVREALHKSELSSAVHHWTQYGRFEGRNVVLLAPSRGD